MSAIRPVLFLAALILFHVVQANLDCYTCGFDGECPVNDSTGRTKECPENTNYCIVEAALKATANHLPASTVKTPTRTEASSTGKPVYYTRRCGPLGLKKPADWTEINYKKENNGLYCMNQNNWKKICYCEGNDCNRHNPNNPGIDPFTTPSPKGEAASDAAKLGMVFSMGILAYVL